MSSELGTITFVVVFTVGAIAMVKNWKKERRRPKKQPPLRLARVKQGRRFSVVESSPKPTGKTQVRIGKDTIWVDDSLISPKEDK